MPTTLTLFDPDDMDEAPLPPLARVRLTVAYDGSAFHGFAPNPGVRTVGGSLVEALERILRHPVDLVCAGRTDKGVHAHGQVVDFVTNEGVDLEGLVRAVNGLCGPAVAVRCPELVPEAFSSRFDAVSRRYRYTIHNGPTPDPFSVRHAWHVRHPLDLDRLRLACDPFIGTHDFTSFCRRRLLRGRDGEQVEGTLVRRIDRLTVRRSRPKGLVLLRIDGKAFCHTMVRAITGSLVEVGRHRQPEAWVGELLAARDRTFAGPVAPPHGLSLVGVTFSRSAPPPYGSDHDEPT